MNQVSFKVAVDDFWRLSVGFYQSSSSQLLDLQNGQGKNINRILFALWFSCRQERLIEPWEVKFIDQQAYAIESFITHVRNFRFSYQAQFEKPYSEYVSKTRNRLLNCELCLEKLHQQILLLVLVAEQNKSIDQQLPFGHFYLKALVSHKKISGQGFNFVELMGSLERDKRNLEQLCGKLQYTNASSEVSYESVIKDWYGFLAKLNTSDL